MQVSEFLEHHLKDNGSYLAGQNVGTVGVNLFPLQRGNAKNHLARATEFLRNVEVRVNKAIKECDSLIVRFGEEFAFSGDQVFIRVGAGSFADSISIETGNVIGHIRGRQDRLSVCVTSRFGDAFLRHMIASSEGFLELEDLGAAPDVGSSEWLLVYLWKVCLKRAFAAGIPKVYVERAGRLSGLRGNFDLNASLRVPTDTGRYPCRYREHAFDNPVTRLIHTTFEMVSKRDNVREMIADAHRLRNAFAEANGGRPVLRPTEYQTRSVRNPYFTAYDEVADLSRKILTHQSADLGLDDEEFSGFLFDVSLLFEHYIRKLLISEGLKLSPKMAGDAIRYPTGGRRRRRLLPDIVLHGPRSTLILDVKYKRWNPCEGVSREDAFQVMSYASAYRKRYEKDKPLFGYGFVFPTRCTARAPIEEEFDELGMRFYVFFLNIPQQNVIDDKAGMNDFENAVRKNETALVRQIRKVLYRDFDPALALTL